MHVIWDVSFLYRVYWFHNLWDSCVRCASWITSDLHRCIGTMIQKCISLIVILKIDTYIKSNSHLLLCVWTTKLKGERLCDFLLSLLILDTIVLISSSSDMSSCLYCVEMYSFMFEASLVFICSGRANAEGWWGGGDGDSLFIFLL